MLIDRKINRVTFLDSRFYFFEEGDIYVPSVTTILESYPKSFGYFEWLKKVGDDADEIRDEAGRKGSIIHKMTEDLDNGDTVNLLDKDDNPLCKMSEWAMFERYVEFRNRFNPKILSIELNMASEKLGYGGTLDRIIELNGKRILIDLKTGNNIYAHFWLQQAAYKELYLEKFPKNKIDAVGILWLNAKTRTNGTKDAIQGEGWQLIQREDTLKDLHLFKCTYELWKAENEGLKPKFYSYTIKHKKLN